MKIYIFIALLSILPAKAFASSGDYYLNLAKCISYATVKGGLDGSKAVPRDYAVTIAALTEEYMFEASVLGFDDNMAHTFVVNELTRQNRIKNINGIEALTAEVGPVCRQLAANFSAAGN